MMSGVRSPAMYMEKYILGDINESQYLEKLVSSLHMQVEDTGLKKKRNLKIDCIYTGSR